MKISQGLLRAALIIVLAGATTFFSSGCQHTLAPSANQVYPKLVISQSLTSPTLPCGVGAAHNRMLDYIASQWDSTLFYKPGDSLIARVSAAASPYGIGVLNLSGTELDQFLNDYQVGLDSMLNTSSGSVYSVWAYNNFNGVIEEVMMDSIANAQDSIFIAGVFNTLLYSSDYYSAKAQLQNLAYLWHNTTFEPGYGAMSAMSIELADSSSSWWHICDSLATASGHQTYRGKSGQTQVLLSLLGLAATDVVSGLVTAGARQLGDRLFTGRNATGDELGDSFFTGAGAGSGGAIGGFGGGLLGGELGHQLWGAIRKSHG